MDTPGVEESIISLEELTRQIREDKVFEEMFLPNPIDTAENQGAEDGKFQLQLKTNQQQWNTLDPWSESENENGNGNKHLTVEEYEQNEGNNDNEGDVLSFGEMLSVLVLENEATVNGSAMGSLMAWVKGVIPSMEVVWDQNVWRNDTHKVFDEITDLVPTARHSFSSVSLIRNERNDVSILNRDDYCKFDEVLGPFSVKYNTRIDIQEVLEPPTFDLLKILGCDFINSNGLKPDFDKMASNLNVDFRIDGVLMFIFDPGGSSWFHIVWYSLKTNVDKQDLGFWFGEHNVDSYCTICRWKVCPKVVLGLVSSIVTHLSQSAVLLATVMTRFNAYKPVWKKFMAAGLLLPASNLVFGILLSMDVDNMAILGLFVYIASAAITLKECPVEILDKLLGERMLIHLVALANDNYNIQISVFGIMVQSVPNVHISVLLLDGGRTKYTLIPSDKFFDFAISLELYGRAVLCKDKISDIVHVQKSIASFTVETLCNVFKLHAVRLEVQVIFSGESIVPELVKRIMAPLHLETEWPIATIVPALVSSLFGVWIFENVHMVEVVNVFGGLIKPLWQNLGLSLGEIDSFAPCCELTKYGTVAEAIVTKEIFPSSKKIIFVMATTWENFIWDPGQCVIYFYILEGKDVFERVGKRIIPMNITWVIMEVIKDVQNNCIMMGWCEMAGYLNSNDGYRPQWKHYGEGLAEYYLGVISAESLVYDNTNNEELLKDEVYIGLRRRRATRTEYAELLHEILSNIKQMYGEKVLIEFEDFAVHNAFKRTFSKEVLEIMASLEFDVVGLFWIMLCNRPRVEELRGSFASHYYDDLEVITSLTDIMLSIVGSSSEAYKMFEIDKGNQTALAELASQLQMVPIDISRDIEEALKFNGVTMESFVWDPGFLVAPNINLSVCDEDNDTGIKMLVVAIVTGISTSAVNLGKTLCGILL